MRATFQSLTRQPRFALGVIATLSLGIGVTVLIFAVLNAVVLRPLPYRDPDRLAMLWTDDVKRGIHEEGVGLPTVLDWRSQSRVFEDFAVCGRGGAATLTDQVEPERVELGVVSSNLWKVLGVEPSPGRSFTEEEDRERARVAVISHGVWLRRFGGARDAIGKRIELDGRPYEVVGVMRDSFHFPSRSVHAWIPLPDQAPYIKIREQREQDFFKVVGRLRRGRTIDEAQREMQQIGHRIALANPPGDPDFAGYGVSVFPFNQQYVGQTLPRALWLLTGAVGLVLMVACANAAGLLLVRNTARGREFAVRAALGADTAALAREQLSEALCLGVASGVAGAALGWAMLRLAMALAKNQVPRLEEATIDLRVLLVAAGAALLTAFLCGPIAAWRVAQTNPGDALRGGGRGISASHRVQWWLAGSQAGLAVVLLTGSGLLVRSLTELGRVNPGFETNGALLVHIERSLTARGGISTNAFWRQLLERLNAIPGARAGAIGDFLIERNPDYAITVEGRATVYNEQVTGDVVTPGFFEASGTRLLKGRLFAPEDFAGGPLRVAIINQTMARRFWPDEDAIGKRLQFGPANARRPWIAVVGVVEDMRRLGLERRAVSEAFGPGFGEGMDLVVRSSPSREGLAAEVRAAIRQVDASTPVGGIVPLWRLLSDSTLSRKLQTGLLSGFAALTLLLAAVGLYGTLQQSVLDQRREFGIRMALGATPAGVVRLVLQRGLIAAGAGAAAGTLVSLWLAQTLQALLFEVRAHDPWALVVAPLVMAVAALAAGFVPAWRASRVNPARVLEG